MSARPPVVRPWIAAGLTCLAGACQCDRTKLKENDGIPKTLSQIDFGNVRVNDTRLAPMALFNNGSAPLALTSQSVDNPMFAIPDKFHDSIPGGGHSDATLSFTPTTSGPVTGTLTINDDGKPTSVSVKLSGNGVDLNLSTMPAALDFGAVTVGLTPSPSQTVTFQNGNNAPVWVTFDTSGTAPEYALSTPAGPVPVGAIDIPAQGWLNLTVTFMPDQVSLFHSSFNYVACIDASGSTCLPPTPFPLNGSGISASLSLSPNPIVFSSVPQGMVTQQTVTVTNTGSAPAMVNCLYFQSLGSSSCGAATGEFTLGLTSMRLPASLGPSSSFTFPVTYLATDAGSDTVAVDYVPQGLTNTATATAPVSGSALPPPCSLNMNPISLTFSQVVAGTPMTQAVTITNKGGVTCSLSGIALDPASDPAFTLATGQPTSMMIAPGATGTISATFNIAVAKAPFARKGRILFSSSDPNQPSPVVSMLATLKSPYAGGGAWPRWHHDNTQSGLSPVDTTPLLGIVGWTAMVGVPPGATSFVRDYMNSPVVGSDGTIYQVGWQGNLYAFNPDGGQQWSVFLQGPLSDPHPTTPIIANDGSVFVAFGEAGAGKGFYQVSHDGGILAQTSPANGGDGFDLPPILTNSGYLLGADDLAGAYAYSIAPGHVFNPAGSGGSFTGAGDPISAAVGSDDTTYFCQGGFSCVAFTSPNAGFAPKPGWSFAMPAGAQDSYTSDLAFDELFTGNLFIIFGGWGSLGHTGSQVLVSVTTTGNINWTRTLPAPSAAQTAADPNYIFEADSTTGNSCPAIGPDGTLYVGNFDGLHAINAANGSDKWVFPSANVLTAAAVASDGTIFFGTDNGTFYAVHPDGSLRFKVSAGGRIAASPAIGPMGNVYLVADDGNLYSVN